MGREKGNARRKFLKRATLTVGAGFAGSYGFSGNVFENTGNYQEHNLPERLLKNARIILETSCRAKEGESVLILAYEKRLPFAPAFDSAALELKLVPAVKDKRGFLSNQSEEPCFSKAKRRISY